LNRATKYVPLAPSTAPIAPLIRSAISNPQSKIPACAISASREKSLAVDEA
jgi:hypothetical protein